MADAYANRLAAMPLEELHVLRWRMRWHRQAREKQLPPPEPWRTWGIRSGRGWGKTQTGANWIGLKAALNPNTYNFIVAPTADDVRHTCMEGPTGIDRYIPKELVVHTDLSMPLRLLWNGSVIRGFAAQSPERLRGPQCLVAGTLVTMADGSQLPIERVVAGQWVQTRNGARRVSWSALTRRDAPIWLLRTVRSRMLHGTSDHPVYVQGKGFVPICELQPDDPLSSWTESTARNPRADTSSGSRSTGQNGIVLTCTAMSTNTTTDLSRLGWSSITRMVIGATTLLRTSLRSLAAIIRAAITPARNSLLRWCADALLLYVARSMPLRSALEPAHYADAISSAKDSVSESGRCATRTALSAGATVVADAVINVERLATPADVYDITVEGEHEFYANGILVHNCHAAWCDEIAAWLKPKLAWDNLKFGHRLGQNPQLLWTSTLKPTPFIRNLIKMPGAVIVSGSTYENAENLAPTFMEDLKKYEGTAIGRQEIHGELLDPEDSGYIRRSQWQVWPKDRPLPLLHFILMSLDTAFTEATFNKKEQEGDPSACSVWGVFEMDKKTHCILLDSWEEHLGFPELIRKVKKERDATYGAPDLPLANERGPMYGAPLYGKIRQGTGRKCDLVLIEDKGSGISLRQALATEDILTHPYNPGKMDKLARLHAISPLFAHKRVWAVESAKNPGQFRSWAEPLVSQVCTYVGPGSTEHDDLLDTTTQALKYISDRFMGAFTLPPKTKEHRIAEEIAARESGKRVNVYAQ